MVCIYCTGKTSVNNSRHQKRTNQTWRRRECGHCRAVFTTIESVKGQQAVSVKDMSGHLEPFSRDTLLLSVYESLKHRKTAISDATALTNTIKHLLFSQLSEGTILRLQIIETTGAVLERFDIVAATHYRAFHKE